MFCEKGDVSSSSVLPPGVYQKTAWESDLKRGARGGNRTRVTSLEGWGNEPLYDTRDLFENREIL